MEIQRLFADRIGGENFGKTTDVYKFAKIKMAKDAARAARPDVALLDFGVGEPDQMAPPEIRAALKAAVDNPDNRGYSDNGIAEVSHAATEYMRTFFGVTDLDPDTQINHSIGSKPALAMLPLAFVDPGDVEVSTVHGYPVLSTHARYLGAEVLDLPEALEPLVEYFRSVAGEHSDWADYRRAMVEQGKCLIRITPRRWGPVATGGFPPR